VVEVDEGVGRPKPALQLLARDNFPGTLQQECEDLIRLFLDFDLDAAPAQFSGARIEFVDAEPHHLGKAIGWEAGHRIVLFLT